MVAKGHSSIVDQSDLVAFSSLSEQITLCLPVFTRTTSVTSGCCAAVDISTACVALSPLRLLPFVSWQQVFPELSC